MLSMKEKLLEQLRHLRVEKHLTEPQRNELFKLESLLNSYNDKLDQLMEEFEAHKQEVDKKLLIVAASEQGKAKQVEKEDLRSLLGQLAFENKRKRMKCEQYSSV